MRLTNFCRLLDLSVCVGRVRLKDKQGDWVFLTPVGNVVLTGAVGNEFKIDRVLFVDRDKLPRIRKRLGLIDRVSEVKRTTRAGFFDRADTYAVVKVKGKPAELETECLRQVKDALSMLTLSQLGYAKRRFVGRIGLFGEHDTTRIENSFLNRSDSSKIVNSRLTQDPRHLILDQDWKNFQKQVFFTDLMKILSGKIRVAPNWRRDLRRASVLAGQSVNSSDVATSFLWNMIAVETLLTQQQDKHAEVLPKRAKAFLGWSGFWQSQDYERRIEDVYRKRNRLVHVGEREAIAKTDLLFTDDLLFNLYANLVRLPYLFGSKEKIVEFTEKAEAEHKLGIKPKVQPEKLIFFSRKYTEKDFIEI